MKLIATSDFRNPDPENIDHANRIHELHIHKGARFQIGGDLPFEKLPASQKRLVTELNVAGRIIGEDQTEKAKAIDAEVAAEEAATKRRAEVEKPAAKKPAKE